MLEVSTCDTRTEADLVLWRHDSVVTVEHVHIFLEVEKKQHNVCDGT